MKTVTTGAYYKFEPYHSQKKIPNIYCKACLFFVMTIFPSYQQFISAVDENTASDKYNDTADLE